jgi:hypothetical protein
VVVLRGREALIDRIRQMRRIAAAGEPAQSRSVDPEPDRVRSLERRIGELESLVQGLQDSVHREASRQAKQIAELDARMQPAALGKALSEDARARGL